MQIQLFAEQRELTPQLKRFAIFCDHIDGVEVGAVRHGTIALGAIPWVFL